MEDDGIKRIRLGTAYLVEPTPGNFVLPLLAHFNIPPNQIIGFMYQGEEFEDLDANKYKDYTIAFFGVSPDKGLPTRFILGGEDGKVLDIWHIIIHWRDIYDTNIEATWSESQHDYVVTMRLGRLDTLNDDVLKYLTDGLALLRWVQERMSRIGRPPGSGWFNNVSEFLTALEEVLKSYRKRPTQLQVLRALDNHRLCRKPGQNRTQSQTKTLRNWIANAGLGDYEKALEKYWPGSRKGK